MESTHPIFISIVAGFASAFIFAALPGPINLTIINEGARRGFRWAILIGLGATVMDCIYCAISFTGFATFFHDPLIKASMQVFSFVFLLFIGFKFLLSQTIHVSPKLEAASEKIEARLEQKLHPHSAFMTGFVRVLGNLGVLLAWIVVSAYLLSHDLVADSLSARFACVGGVFTGAMTVFLALSYGISRGHGKFRESTMLRLQHLSGFGLIIAGCFAGIHIIWHLAHHRL